MMKNLMVLTAAGLSVFATAANAATLDFTTLTPGTAVTTTPLVTVSLAGGPDSSGPARIGYGFFDTAVSLNNSTNAGELDIDGNSTDSYPTANILNFAFDRASSAISFTFNNYGSGNGTFYTAFGAGNVVVSTGIIDSINDFSTVTVGGAGITSLQINNNVGPNDSYVFGVGQLNFTPVPEPTSWAMMIVGFGIAGGALRTRSRTRTRVAFAA